MYLLGYSSFVEKYNLRDQYGITPDPSVATGEPQ